jgi:hypothetical protein
MRLTLCAMLFALSRMSPKVIAGPTAAAPASGHSEEAGGIVRRRGVLTEEEEVPKPRPG